MSATPRLPPVGDQDFSSSAWQQFFRDISVRVGVTGVVTWALVNKAGANITDIPSRNHGDLLNINTAGYTHLTATNHTDLTDGGDSTLHFHATDRALANITGLAANMGAFLADPTSAKLAATLTDETGTAGKVVFDTSPTITTPSVVSQTVSGTAGNLYAGIWTPTLTNGTNVAASTPHANSFFIRVGNIIHVGLSVEIDCTAAGAFDLQISLPVASDFAATDDASGVAHSVVGGGSVDAVVYADTTNNTLILSGVTVSTTNNLWMIEADYQIV